MDTATLLADLSAALPGFAEYVASEENLFDDDTLAGVFAACSWFVRRRAVGAERWPALAELVNGAAGAKDRALSDAACTCFIENIASPDHPLAPLLAGEALRYWSYCSRSRPARGNSRTAPSCG